MTDTNNEQVINEELNVTSAEIKEAKQALDNHDRNVRPAIWTAFVISAVLSIIGLDALFPANTPAQSSMVVGLGAAIALVNGYFWTNLFKRSKDAATNGGWAAFALLFLVIGPMFLAPSMLTNIAAVTVNEAKILDDKQTTAVYSVAINKTGKIKSQFETLHNFLSGQESAFDTRHTNEVDGRGTGRGGSGHVSNALLEVQGRFVKHVPIAKSGLRQYETLRDKLDSQFAEFQQIQQNNEGAERSLETTRNDMNSTIAAIAALNPAQYARSAANHVAGEIPIPVGARPFQVEAIRGIQGEIARLVTTINEMAAGFGSIEAPRKAVRSKAAIAWSNALQNLHVVILAVMIDLFAPALFLMKLPGLLAIAAKLKRLKTQYKDLRQNLVRLQGPSLPAIFDYTMSELLGCMEIFANAKDRAYTIGMKGEHALEIGADGYRVITKDAPHRLTLTPPPQMNAGNVRFKFSEDFCETFMAEDRKAGA